MIGRLLQAFLSLQLVSTSVSFDPGWLLFDAVLGQEVPSRTCHGRIFGAPASPLVRGDYFTKASLVSFLRKLSGSLDGEVVQRMMAICDQWVWFLGTGGPCQVSIGGFRFEKNSYIDFTWLSIRPLLRE